MEQITKDLLFEKENSLRKQEQIVEQTKQLLSHEAAEDLKILRLSGLAHNIVMAEDEQTRLITMKENEIKYGQVYTIDHIKRICINYRLRFLPSKLYKGYVSPEIIPAIKELLSTHLQSEYQLQNELFIMARASEFDLKEVPLTFVKDPLLFWRIDDTHYKLVKKWGNDFTFLRKILAYPFRKSIWLKIMLVISWVCMSGAILRYALPLEADPTFHAVVGMVLFIVSIIVFFMHMGVSDFWEYLDEFASEENWNSRTRIKL